MFEQAKKRLQIHGSTVIRVENERPDDRIVALVQGLDSLSKVYTMMGGAR